MKILWVGGFDAWARFTEAALGKGHTVELHPGNDDEVCIAHAELVVVDRDTDDAAHKRHAERLARHYGRPTVHVHGSNVDQIERLLASISHPAA